MRLGGGGGCLWCPPQAANEEVKRLEKSIEGSEAALREQRDRLRIMEEHLFNVQQEVGTEDTTTRHAPDRTQQMAATLRAERACAGL